MHRPEQPAEPADLNLATGWYVALRSAALRGSPVRVELFGSPFVVWRVAGRAPVLMPLHCPHMGAALAGGRVVDGTLECPFHRWRYRPDGGCATLPNGRRPPATAQVQVQVLPTTERDGYVWVWYGQGAPLYPLPGPALTADEPTAHRVFQLEDPAGTTARRILENTFDPDHLVALHGLTVRGRTETDLLDSERADALFGPADVPQARLGAVFSWPAYSGWLGRFSDVAGLNADRFELRVAAWPTLQHIWYHADGLQLYHLVLGVTPVAADRSVQHIAGAKHGRRTASRLRYVMHRGEVTIAARQDLPIFDTMRSGDWHGIYVPGDRALRKFRHFYQRWTETAGDGV
ncbi:MAG: Rieske (2Fe-2S) protein [Micrococcales bacterium]|nr:MAG: Rieske (2Fe-2S) protein [Micrococcales bacterium]PIE27493.1 MAG: Rieske (2Fe-2S) protein [Micrococcales bacterium]